MELQKKFQVTFDVVADTKGWRKKQVVEILSDFLLGMKEIGAKVFSKASIFDSRTKWSYCLLPQDDPETASNLWTVLRGTLLFNCNCTLAKEDQRSVVAVVFDDFLVLLLLRVILTLNCLE